MAINLSKELEKIIEANKREGIVPTLLLHCCCAPCSSSVLEYLTKHFRITVLFFNPNINIPEEYAHRYAEFRRLLTEMEFENPVKIRECEYNPQVFYDVIKGLENEPEGGSRCRECFRLRLGETAKIAAENGFDYFTTTLSISPLKNSAVLFEIASERGEKYGATPLPSDFKKKDGYKRSLELSRLHNLYRQNYCGCRRLVPQTTPTDD